MIPIHIILVDAFLKGPDIGGWFKTRIDWISSRVRPRIWHVSTITALIIVLAGI